MTGPLYSTLDSVRAVLDRIETFEDFCARHPIRKERVAGSNEVFYVFYDPYWFPAGTSLEAAAWTQRQGWRWAFDRTTGVIWC